MSGPEVAPPKQISASWLNGLSDTERAEFLAGEWARGMHKWAASHTTFFRWTRRSLLGTVNVSSGSVFFLQLQDKLLAVTAAHVYEGYVADKKKQPQKIVCHLGNVPFDPEARLVGLGSSTTIDIATFWITWDELRQIGKQAVIGSPWPPPIPMVGQAVFLSGFPGKTRFWTQSRALSVARYSGLNKVDQVNDEYVTCVLDPAFWVGIKGERLPPKLTDIGGLSGGPLLVPQETKNGEWHLTLAAVISNGAFGSIVYAVRADLISEDGSIISAQTAGG